MQIKALPCLLTLTLAPTVCLGGGPQAKPGTPAKASADARASAKFLRGLPELSDDEDLAVGMATWWPHQRARMTAAPKERAALQSALKKLETNEPTLLAIVSKGRPAFAGRNESSDALVRVWPYFELLGLRALKRTGWADAILKAELAAVLVEAKPASFIARIRHASRVRSVVATVQHLLWYRGRPSASESARLSELLKRLEHPPGLTEAVQAEIQGDRGYFKEVERRVLGTKAPPKLLRRAKAEIQRNRVAHFELLQAALRVTKAPLEEQEREAQAWDHKVRRRLSAEALGLSSQRVLRLPRLIRSDLVMRTKLRLALATLAPKAPLPKDPFGRGKALSRSEGVVWSLGSELQGDLNMSATRVSLKPVLLAGAKGPGQVVQALVDTQELAALERARKLGSSLVPALLRAWIRHRKWIGENPNSMPLLEAGYRAGHAPLLLEAYRVDPALAKLVRAQGLGPRAVATGRRHVLREFADPHHLSAALVELMVDAGQSDLLGGFLDRLKRGECERVGVARALLRAKRGGLAVPLVPALEALLARPKAPRPPVVAKGKAKEVFAKLGLGSFTVSLPDSAGNVLVRRAPRQEALSDEDRGGLAKVLSEARRP